MNKWLYGLVKIVRMILVSDLALAKPTSIVTRYQRCSWCFEIADLCDNLKNSFLINHISRRRAVPRLIAKSLHINAMVDLRRWCLVLQLSRILILCPEQEFYLRGKSVGCRSVVSAARSRDMPDACLVLLVIGVSFPTHSEWR